MELDEGEIVDEGESLLTNGSDSKLAEEKPTTEPQPAEPSNNGVDEPEEGELTEEGELVEDDMPRRSRSPSLRFGSQGGQTPGLPTPEVLDTPSRAETVVEVDRGPSLQETIARYKGLDSYDDYEPNEKVGQGTFGEVVVARHKRTHEKVALKRIIVHKKHEGLPITSVREIIILKALHHENIIRLNSLAFSKGNEAEYEPAQIYMVFPYMDHDLYGLLKNAQVMLYPAQIKSFAKQMLDGLNYLHTNRMLHRDMKSANILVDDRGHLTIGDFGLARRHVTYGNSVTTLTPTVVTLWYRPPEILLEEKKYNSAVDMWGFGCIFAEMWDRHPLFQVGTEALALDKIFTVCGTPNAIDWPSFPSILERQKLEPRKETRKVREMYRPDRFDFHTINFLDALLKVNPAKRLTAKEALAHEYFQVEPLPAQPGTIDFPGWPESHEMAIQERLNGERERAHQNARRRGEATPRYESNLPLHGDVLLIQGVPTPRRPLPVSDRGTPRRHGGDSYDRDSPRTLRRRRSSLSPPPERRHDHRHRSGHPSRETNGHYYPPQDRWQNGGGRSHDDPGEHDRHERNHDTPDRRRNGHHHRERGPSIDRERSLHRDRSRGPDTGRDRSRDRHGRADRDAGRPPHDRGDSRRNPDIPPPRRSPAPSPGAPARRPPASRPRISYD